MFWKIVFQFVFWIQILILFENHLFAFKRNVFAIYEYNLGIEGLIWAIIKYEGFLGKKNFGFGKFI